VFALESQRRPKEIETVQSKPKFQVRPPWPDEMRRLQHYLPPAFLFDATPFLLVAVSGRVQRFVGALGMTLRPLEKIRATWMCMRLEEGHPSGPQLIQCALEEAWKRQARSVYFSQTIDEDTPGAVALQSVGFKATAVHEVYEIDVKELFQRIDAIFQRLKQRNRIPTNVEITTLQPSVIPKARKFLADNLMNNASALALETAGYKADTSLALVQDGQIKGVLLSRRTGNVSHTGLRVVDTELRGGLGWANLLLLHTSLLSGLQTGLEKSRFEFDPEQHLDTKQFAEIQGATLVGRRLLLKIDNPAEKVLTEERIMN
jgi:hypothetical protein